MSRIKLAFVSLAALCTVAGCARQDDEVAKLTARVEALEKHMASHGGGAAGAASPALEQEAKNAFTAVNQLVAVGQIDQARAKIASYGNKYKGTQVGKQMMDFAKELAVVGKDSPADWGIEKWFQGQDQIKLDGQGTTVVVFWEQWCPHCKNEVPKLQEMYDKFKGDGLKLLGVTKGNQGATEQAVTDFIATSKVSYPIAKENGTLTRYFSVSGIPAAAVVKDGKVVWRGHPVRLTDGMIRGWLKS